MGSTINTAAAKRKRKRQSTITNIYNISHVIAPIPETIEVRIGTTNTPTPATNKNRPVQENPTQQNTSTNTYEHQTTAAQENKFARYSPRQKYEVRKKQKICHEKIEATDEISQETNDDTKKSTANSKANRLHSLRAPLI